MLKLAGKEIKYGFAPTKVGFLGPPVCKQQERGGLLPRTVFAPGGRRSLPYGKTQGVCRLWKNKGERSPVIKP